MLPFKIQLATKPYIPFLLFFTIGKHTHSPPVVTWEALIYPTNRAVERLIYPDDDDGIPFHTLRDLCIAALEKFSPTSLVSHGRKIGNAPGASRPEAQYAYELYRCIYKVTGGKCIVHGEYSYTTKGRIDFFIKKRAWGIEVIKDGDRVDGHIARFEDKGMYGSWNIVKEYILLDFRTKLPIKKRGRMNHDMFSI